MAGMPYPPNLCASVPICGRHFSARRFCVFRVFCGTLSLFALLVLQRQLHQRGSILPTESTDFHRWLGCVIGGVGMAGMPYPPNLCASVPICGRLSLPEGSVCSACSVGHSLPVCLVMSVVVFSHGIHGFPQMVRLRYWQRGYGRMPYPPNLCLSVGGTSLPEGSVCSVCSVGHSLCLLCWCICGRHISAGFRPPPDQIASAARSDCVRHPIGFRSPSDQIPSAARCHK